MIDLETVDKIFKDYASKFGFTNITIKKYENTLRVKDSLIRKFIDNNIIKYLNNT